MHHSCYLFLIFFARNGAHASKVHSNTKANIEQYHSTDSIESLVRSFKRDLRNIQSLPPSRLTTPCILSARDATSTYPWTLQNWEACSTHSLSRYIHHFRVLPASTTARYIFPTVLATTIWSIFISVLSNHAPIFPKIEEVPSSKFSVMLTFLQAPLLLLFALRANRALDRLLEARRAWAGITRSARTLMGIISSYILPTQPEIALLMGRYLAILGWSLKGILRDEDDADLIHAVLGRSYKQEFNWIGSKRADGNKCPIILICRVRNLLATAVTNDEKAGRKGIALQRRLIARMEEVLHQIETGVGLCNRILMSPTPPVFTAHSSRIIGFYLLILPLALTSMGSSTMTTICASFFTSYVLVGIDEIGCFIEHPFPIIPMDTMSKIIQTEVERQVDMVLSMPVL